MSLQGSKVFKGPDMSLLRSKQGPGMNLHQLMLQAMKMRLCFKSIELRMVPWLLDLHLLGMFNFESRHTSYVCRKKYVYLVKEYPISKSGNSSSKTVGYPFVGKIEILD
jgi:hypothetical protein